MKVSIIMNRAKSNSRLLFLKLQSANILAQRQSTSLIFEQTYSGKRISDMFKST